MTASRKISSVPPDRQGFSTTRTPSGATASAAEGVTRSSSDSPDASSRNPSSRTVDSAHTPPTNPSIEPSGSTSALSPGLALVGRSARTTVAST